MKDPIKRTKKLAKKRKLYKIYRRKKNVLNDKGEVRGHVPASEVRMKAKQKIVK